MNRYNTVAVVAVVAALVSAGCDMEIDDLNNPSSSEVEANPTRPLIQAMATGLLIGHRERMAIDNGYVAVLGVLGREALIFAASDPGFVTELLHENPGLDPGSAISGEAFWLYRYRNINNAFRILRLVDKVADMTDAEKQAVRGFAKTIQALDFLVVINTRDTHGAPIDVDRPYGSELPPIACKDSVFQYIVRLLDEAQSHLEAGGNDFPFPLSAGLTELDTPAGFLQLNRAIKARVEVYRGRYEEALDALAASFIEADADDPRLGFGAYHTFTEGQGDALNELVNLNIYAHPSLLTDAEPGDLRLSKIRVLNPELDLASEKPGVQSYTDPNEEVRSDVRFTIYPDHLAPVPIIRNEELILLRAEANLGIGTDEAVNAALEDINFIRRHAGGLPEFSRPEDQAVRVGDLVDELLHQRRYSLLFEGGHRWIDMRRFKSLDELPIDSTRHVVHEKFPLPQAEVDARQNNVACVP